MSSSLIKNKRSLAVDWIVLIVILALTGITSKIPPFERQFDLDDITISHPYKGDTVKMSVLIAFGLVSSFIVITGFQYYKKDLTYNYHQAIIGIALSMSISTLFAHFVKMFVGRYRPDFISVCDVDFDKVQEQYNSYNISSDIGFGPRHLFNTTICKNTKENLYEERRSFPSGHSSFSFSVMSYLSLYIAGQIHLLDKKAYMWKYFAVSIPYFFAVFVAVSRVFDYRHHWQDVTIGSIIGIVFGFLSYYYYYPSLRDSSCDKPYQRLEEVDTNERNGYREALEMA
ncbi:acid phosphatase/Vanadium-dependent haloperoxidase [Neocallimastix lanati (nom. inval.)]|jgi:diacylglycerol diphosphate phosphatase/phosphatidate phosphatase|uniref:Acid phosphatase/Vanadium-dependent haloperoxidase n=1 Tax=Neocallimastix californiae TaxID=1754190 RepID=A0A1Y2DZZ4_9FUNG|nr:acid phosphatase/Vanadium-dependent haloperoxidase [Neocallimastix sp. JGI-2020a]ORY64676.1 acid phosphatase/Vanadium-dependent haloperoxidase [Neocallimastix californiae]|eukprot:ORY64676.1 acid phosphatase/Vanadium-dependent haloperoxidase [Neocallimastix californiae]